jgi:hypothetical protein
VATQSFVLQGGIVDLAGRSKTCAWDMSASSCT